MLPIAMSAEILVFKKNNQELEPEHIVLMYPPFFFQYSTSDQTD